MPISLKISLPDRVYLETKADKVILPVSQGTLTIIHGRAPRSQLLVQGEISLLDHNNKTFKQWKIGGGIAEIFNDICLVAVEKIDEIKI